MIYCAAELQMSLYTVEKPGFIRILKTINPWYALPKYFAEHYTWKNNIAEEDRGRFEFYYLFLNFEFIFFILG